MSAGTLETLDRGILKGAVRLDDRLRRQSELTIEVLAHGIALATHVIAMPQEAGDSLAFAFDLAGFPDVALPCDLRARIVETDSLLDSAVRLGSVEEIWAALMPFSVRVEQTRHNMLTLRLTEHVPGTLGRQRPVFQLRDWGRPVTISAPTHDIGGTSQVIMLPDSLLDGSEHRLSILHEQSGLPVTTRPIMMRLDVQMEPGPDLADVARRLERLETSVHERYAEAFAQVVTPLYRHIDAMVQNQRTNFEREIAALRRLLGVAGDAAVPAALAAETRIEFSGPVVGFGVHDVQHTTSGKPFRHVAPLSGILLPGLRDGAATLHVQGIRRANPAALDQAAVAVNGHALPHALYLNPKSESWNITAHLGPGVLRPDRNLVELRLPQYGPAWAAPERVAGIIHVAVTRRTAEAGAAAAAE